MNRNPDVPDGFRGDVHPMLHGRTPLAVTAHWTAPAKSQLKMEAPDAVQACRQRFAAHHPVSQSAAPAALPSETGSAPSSRGCFAAYHAAAR